MLLTATKAEDLFTYGATEDLTKQYRKLSSMHHPDKGGTAEDFQLVKALYEEARYKVECGAPWDNGSDVMWSGESGKLRLHYLLKRTGETGQEYSGGTRVLYTATMSNEDLLKTAVDNLKIVAEDLGPTAQVREINRKLFPRVVDSASSALLVSKGIGEVPLKAVYDTYGAFAQDHAVWIASRLMHLLCYLEHLDMVHGAILLENLYVNLEEHSLHLTGGWGFAQKEGKKFKALPAKAMRFVTEPYAAEKRLDWALARQTVVEMLGHKVPTELRMRKDLNPAFLNFLVSPWSAASARDLYSQWEKVRAQLGPRRFVKFVATSPLVFKE